MNLISRRPRFARDTRVRTMFGSYNLYSAGFMHTGPLVRDRAAFLIGASITDRPDGWADWTYRKESSLQAAATPRLAKNLSIRLPGDRPAGRHTQHISFTHPAFLAAIRLYDSQAGKTFGSCAATNESPAIVEGVSGTGIYYERILHRGAIIREPPSRGNPDAAESCEAATQNPRRQP